MSKLLFKIGCLHNNQRLICEIKGTEFGALSRILKFIVPSKGSWPVHIYKSVISQPVKNYDFYVHIDISGILNANLKGLSMHFLCTRSKINAFSELRHEPELLLLEEDSRRYVITDGHVRYELEKSDESFPERPAGLEQKVIGTGIPNPPLKKLKGYIGKSKIISFRVFEDQVEQMQVPGKRPYTFTTGNIQELSGKDPDLVLISSRFPEIVGKDKLTLSLARDDQGEHWLLTESELIRGVNARTFERLEK